MKKVDSISEIRESGLVLKGGQILPVVEICSGEMDGYVVIVKNCHRGERKEGGAILKSGS